MGKYRYIYHHFLNGGYLGYRYSLRCLINKPGNITILIHNVPGISDELLLKYGVFK